MLTYLAGFLYILLGVIKLPRLTVSSTNKNENFTKWDLKYGRNPGEILPVSLKK